jgi:hypothetical protein
MQKFYRNNLIGLLLFAFLSVFLINQSIGFLPDPIVFLWGLVSTIITVVWLIWTVNDDWENQNRNKHETGYPTLPKKGLTWIILLLVLGGLIKLCMPLPKLYNKHKVYEVAYNQKTTELQGFYDKMWKTYLQKDKITNVNKEVFIEVARIQMENRRDGAAVTWKWVQENSQIPYSEFTKFYSDLSSFIKEQRDAYYALEVQRQTIASSHNLLLDSFPNNIYNKVLRIEPITFNYGFLSDSTKKVFDTRIENVK